MSDLKIDKFGNDNQKLLVLKQVAVQLRRLFYMILERGPGLNFYDFRKNSSNESF